MKVKFTKMHGLGNDFIVFDAIRQAIALDQNRARRLANRHFGIGCDQILLVENARDPANDFAYRIFNADGNEVEQCGNGARCFASFVYDKGLTEKTRIRVETSGGIIVTEIEQKGLVSVDMGAPIFTPAEIPFISDQIAASYLLTVNGMLLEFSVLSMGNPHAVMLVDNVATTDVEGLGAIVQAHPGFPHSVNVGFMQVDARSRIRLRVFERGSGETLACGTGACAAAVSGIRRGLLDSPVSVTTRGGELTIAWADNNAPVIMTGSAVKVFDGEIDLDDFWDV